MFFPICFSVYGRFCASAEYFSYNVYVYNVNVNIIKLLIYLSVYLPPLVRIYVLFSLISIHSHSIINL